MRKPSGTLAEERNTQKAAVTKKKRKKEKEKETVLPTYFASCRRLPWRWQPHLAAPSPW